MNRLTRKNGMKKSITYGLALLLTSLTTLSATAPHRIPRMHCTVHPIDASQIHPQGAYTPSTTNQTVSSNWSGYVASKNLLGGSASHGTVTDVSGSWVVPTLTATSNGAYSAVWVGIDGYSSSTVEQIGTSHNWVGGSQQNYAWFEMYPNGAYEIVGFPVDKGDIISAEVSYIGNNTFKLQLTNQTKRVTTIIPRPYTTSTSAARSCAEWVVEAPYSGQILPLADFRSVTMSSCSTTIGGIKGPINSGSWQNSEITMEGAHAAVESLPSSLADNGTEFQVSWKSE